MRRRAPSRAGSSAARRGGTTRRRAARSPPTARRAGSAGGGTPGGRWRSAMSRLRERRACRSRGSSMLPVVPGDLVVLAPGVVVAALACGAISSPPSSIGTPCESSSVARKLRCWRLAQRDDLGVVGRPLDAAVPRAVVVGAVAVVLEVGLVVLLVVGDEVGEREAVVGGDEVDRRERAAAVGLVEVARAGQALGERRRRCASPRQKSRIDVAVDAVPLRPQHGEVADLVAARARRPTARR